MDRRQFLRVAAVSSAVALTPKRWMPTFTSQSVSSGSILNHPASAAPIDTVVVLMMENRSFDHYFGWLAGSERYLERGRNRHGRDFSVAGKLNQAFPDPATGKQVKTYYLPGKDGQRDPWRGCGHPDPGHGPWEGRAQRDRGFLARGSGNDEFALGYFGEDDLPAYAPLARNFTIFDNYHASLLSSTYPNRLYLQSAQCGPNMDPGLPIAQGGFDWPSIWDRLFAAGVSCANYFVDIPSGAFFGPRVFKMLRPFEAFFAQAATGTLPQVSMLDPGWLTGFRTDDHPIADMRTSQKFVATVVRALMSSPQWKRTALFITYDEWGGFFDHVAPPLMADNRASSVDTKNFGQAGFRVPTLMISPYAPTNYVDHAVYDHTSILRFIEWRFLGAPAFGPGGKGWWLTERDKHANNIGAALQTHRTGGVFDISAVPRVLPASTPCENFWFQDVPTLKDHDKKGEFHRIERPVSGMELFAYDGYLDAIKFKQQQPSVTLADLTSAF